MHLLLPMLPTLDYDIPHPKADKLTGWDQMHVKPHERERTLPSIPLFTGNVPRTRLCPSPGVGFYRVRHSGAEPATNQGKAYHGDTGWAG